MKKSPPVAGSAAASRSAALRRLARGLRLWRRRRASRCGRIGRPARSGDSFTTSDVTSSARRSPWLDIPLADYEGHMSLPEVGQARLLADLLAAAIDRHALRSIAVLGCAGAPAKVPFPLPRRRRRVKSRLRERTGGADRTPEAERCGHSTPRWFGSCEPACNDRGGCVSAGAAIRRSRTTEGEP